MQTNGQFEHRADHAAYEAYLASLGSDDSAFRASFRDAFFRALREELTGRRCV